MRIYPEKTIGLIIDLQERLVPHMYEMDELLQRSVVLLKGLTLLNLPLIYTEQYPAGLGKTVDGISSLLTANQAIEKLAFSCCDEPAVITKLKDAGRTTVLVAGIESHVCVLQTAIDLKTSGFDPVIVADAVSSRRKFDKRIALERMVHEGCRMTTVESVLFELMRSARCSCFKEISRLVK